MKTAQWYYKELDKIEKLLAKCKDESEKEKLKKELDKLHDELYELDV